MDLLVPVHLFVCPFVLLAEPFDLGSHVCSNLIDQIKQKKYYPEQEKHYAEFMYTINPIKCQPSVKCLPSTIT